MEIGGGREGGGNHTHAHTVGSTASRGSQTTQTNTNRLKLVVKRKVQNEKKTELSRFN